MKTTDGHEVKKHGYYYLESGQIVILEQCATDESGKTVYLVTPFYEGESMSVNGDGGTHNEVTSPYEHEGELTLVDSIFLNAPLEKLDKRYKIELDKVGSLSVSIGELKKHLNKLTVEKSKLTLEISKMSKTCKASKENDLQARNMLNSTNEEVNKKRQELSELEDSISNLKTKDVSNLISKTELQRLNKRDFELQCLENGGVDNWEWYSESLKDFNERYPEG